MSQFTPKFIYFDLDDTLLNHKKAEQNALSDLKQQYNLFSDVEIEELKSTYHNINKNLWEQYGKGEIDRHILHRKRFEDTMRELRIDSTKYTEAGELYMSFYRKHWEWIDGAELAFEQIRDRFPVGLITNGFAETQWLKIKQFNFEELVSQIVISEEVGVMKPHPKIFNYSTELVGVDRSEILYVGDSLTSDVIGAKKAGWKVAWFTSSPTSEDKDLADFVFDDFEELVDFIN